MHAQGTVNREQRAASRSSYWTNGVITSKESKNEERDMLRLSWSAQTRKGIFSEFLLLQRIRLTNLYSGSSE